MKGVNLYMGLVQEFFHIRVHNWLECVGKILLHIKHYWGAFEFTKGSGHIHIHMLAITNDQTIRLKKYYELIHEEKHDKKRSDLMANYDRDVFNMTSIHPGYEHLKGVIKYSKKFNKNYTSALDMRYIDTKKENGDQDLMRLCHACQTHFCTEFFILHRKRNYGIKTKRFCRSGSGNESSPGTYETDGFPLQQDDEIKFDARGYKVLNLKRTNSKRLVQSSMIMLHSWRANCDVKILIYDTDPKNPDLGEISKVRDYILSYTCKGHLTIDEEKISLLMMWKSE